MSFLPQRQETTETKFGHENPSVVFYLCGEPFYRDNEGVTQRRQAANWRLLH